MLARMKTKVDVKRLIAKLRKNVDPKWRDEITAVADSLEDLVDNAAKEFGRSGGRARAKKLSAKRKKDIATDAARARWDKKK